MPFWHEQISLPFLSFLAWLARLVTVTVTVTVTFHWVSRATVSVDLDAHRKCQQRDLVIMLLFTQMVARVPIEYSRSEYRRMLSRSPERIASLLKGFTITPSILGVSKSLDYSSAVIQHHLISSESKVQVIGHTNFTSR